MEFFAVLHCYPQRSQEFGQLLPAELQITQNLVMINGYPLQAKRQIIQMPFYFMTNYLTLASRLLELSLRQQVKQIRGLSGR